MPEIMAWKGRDVVLRAYVIAMLASLAFASNPSRSLLQAPAQRGGWATT